mmetsp:Transcript_5515/g.9724  ORF Transcript_5515/g.9724 Transcript_5515/m.9724 type:complete len:210 (+) Transcript_5515:532-1161(+)
MSLDPVDETGVSLDPVVAVGFLITSLDAPASSLAFLATDRTPVVFPAAPAALASASFRLASSPCSCCTAKSKLSNKLVAPPTSATGFVPSPRFAASASTILASSDRYDTAALLLYFLSGCPPYKSENPCFRKKARAFPFPPILMASTCRCVHSSKSSDRTNVRCTPMLRCVEEQSKHRSTPWVTLAHVGRVFGQSKQVWLSRIALSFLN